MTDFERQMLHDIEKKARYLYNYGGVFTNAYKALVVSYLIIKVGMERN